MREIQNRLPLFRTLTEAPFGISLRQSFGTAVMCTLDLREKGITGSHMADFSLAISRGALVSLKELRLSLNAIGDDGIDVFSSTLSSGALASLWALGLSDNQISDKGIKVLSSALSSGVMGALTILDLARNQISGEGMGAISATLCSGALRSLKTLRLNGNHIGDSGMKAFSDAISVKAPPASLANLDLDDNQISDRGIKVFSSVLCNQTRNIANVIFFGGNPINDACIDAFECAHPNMFCIFKRDFQGRRLVFDF